MSASSDLDKIVNKIQGIKQFLLGGTDATAIGNTSDRLKVDASISSVTAAVSAAYSSKTRVVTLSNNISISSGGGYTTVYTYSGSGFLIGFNLEFNNTDIVVRLRIDGEVVFDGTSIGTYNGYLVTANDTGRRQGGSGIVTSSSTLDWSLKQPIRYGTSVTIDASTGGGLFTRTFNQGIIYLTKET